MGSPSDLSLDYKPNSYSMIQKPLGDQPDQTQKIEEFLARLEEERLKIEAFKRELPLCMQLLNSAVETYRQQLETYQTNQAPRPVLEEFIPLKHTSLDGSEKAPNAPSEKASWMVSAQLWSPANDATRHQPLTAPPLKDTEHAFDVSPKLALDTKQRNGGAFLPFSKEKNKGMGSASRGLPELALASSEKAVEEKKSCVELDGGSIGARRDINGGKGGGAEQGKGGSNPTEGQPAPQTHRKARRCWSPDLHRLFVNALQILGGSQVATPKQIRELMKVDGLTNDEVKSHLQKYRLHTRRPIPAPQASVAAAPQLVVLGGIWVPPEYATSAATAGPAIYGAHAAQAHYCSAPVPQELYAAPPPPHLHHHLHPALHRTTAAATSASAYKNRLGSPESEVRSGGERSESIEEEEEGEEREEEEEEEEDMEAAAAMATMTTTEGKAEEKALVPLAVKAEEGGGRGGEVALKI